MNKDQEKKGGCCSCEQDFRNEVNELVNEVDGYTHKDHEEKKKEVKAAFEEKNDK